MQSSEFFPGLSPIEIFPIVEQGRQKTCFFFLHLLFAEANFEKCLYTVFGGNDLISRPKWDMIFDYIYIYTYICTYWFSSPVAVANKGLWLRRRGSSNTHKNGFGFPHNDVFAPRKKVALHGIRHSTCAFWNHLPFSISTKKTYVFPPVSLCHDII